MNYEKVSKRNPLGLGVGIWILAKNTCEFGYVYNSNQRDIIRKPYGKPLQITGIVRRAVGDYREGSSRNTIDGWDHDPPYLRVSKYVWVYECREAMWSKPVLVHPDDVVLV